MPYYTKRHILFYVEKFELMSELTEHTLANEIEAPHEILRK